MPSPPPSSSSAGWEPTSSSGPARGGSAPLEADLAAEWFTGWVGAACEQQTELAAESEPYTRRRLAEAAAGQLAVTVGPRRPAGPAPSRSGTGMSRTVWTWARLAGVAATFAVLVWRLGTGPFIDGVRTVDGQALAAAAGIAVVITVCCAWRWKIVARGLGIDLPLPAAVGAYYRSQFLNVTLPGGVVGDVHRGYQPRPRRERRQPRAAGRRLGAIRRAGRAGRPDRRRPDRAAVTRALVDAAGRDRPRRGCARRRAPGSRATRRRPLPAGASAEHRDRPTSATDCSPAGRGWPSRCCPPWPWAAARSPS